MGALNLAAHPTPRSPSGEAALRDAMEAYMLTHGFTRLELTITSLRAEIARDHRHLLALEGWVA